MLLNTPLKGPHLLQPWGQGLLLNTPLAGRRAGERSAFPSPSSSGTQRSADLHSVPAASGSQQKNLPSFLLHAAEEEVPAKHTHSKGESSGMRKERPFAPAQPAWSHGLASRTAGRGRTHPLALTAAIFIRKADYLKETSPGSGLLTDDTSLQVGMKALTSHSGLSSLHPVVCNLVLTPHTGLGRRKGVRGLWGASSVTCLRLLRQRLYEIFNF